MGYGVSIAGPCGGVRPGCYVPSSSPGLLYHPLVEVGLRSIHPPVRGFSTGLLSACWLAEYPFFGLAEMKKLNFQPGSYIVLFVTKLVGLRGYPSPGLAKILPRVAVVLFATNRVGLRLVGNPSSGLAEISRDCYIVSLAGVLPPGIVLFVMKLVGLRGIHRPVLQSFFCRVAVLSSS